MGRPPPSEGKESPKLTLDAVTRGVASVATLSQQFARTLRARRPDDDPWPRTASPLVEDPVLARRDRFVGSWSRCCWCRAHLHLLGRPAGEANPRHAQLPQAITAAAELLFGRIDVSSAPGRTVFTGDSDRKCRRRIHCRADRCSVGDIPQVARAAGAQQGVECHPHAKGTRARRRHPHVATRCPADRMALGAEEAGDRRATTGSANRSSASRAASCSSCWAPQSEPAPTSRRSRGAPSASSSNGCRARARSRASRRMRRRRSSSR